MAYFNLDCNMMMMILKAVSLAFHCKIVIVNIRVQKTVTHAGTSKLK